MRFICALSLVVLAGGCASTRVKAITGPTGNPSYSITCYQDRGLCYRAAYDTCKGGYYIMDAAAVARGTTGREVPVNQDRPGRAAQEHTLLVQCTGSGPSPDALLAIGGPTGPVTADRRLLLDPARNMPHGATVLPPASRTGSSSYYLSRDPYKRPYRDPSRLSQRNRGARGQYYRGAQSPYGRGQYADPYGNAGANVYYPPYSEYAVPPYPGYRGRYRGSRRRKKRSSKKKAATKKAAPAKKAADDCVCP